MLIADRGFCDLWTLAEKKFYGEFARIFMKMSSFGWQANNSFNYLGIEKGESRSYKVIICDPADEIVDLQASILVGAANEICHL